MLVWFVSARHRAGRHVYAVGNNPEATRLTGIATAPCAARRVHAGRRVLRHRVAAVGGAHRVGDPNAGQTENLDGITAVVLGGTSLFGGRGVILGTLIGALIVGVFRNGLTLMGVSSVYQILITGMLVILAVATDQLSRRKGSSMTPAAQRTPVLQARGLVKRYGHVTALDGADFELRPARSWR